MIETNIVIFDIDGTIADASHRVHYIRPAPGEKKSWKKFFAEAANDSPMDHTIAIAKAMVLSGYSILFITGRPERLRSVTETWLENQGLDNYIGLLMRPDNDFRPDYEVKHDLFFDVAAEQCSVYAKDILCVFEDRPQVINMWKRVGFKVVVCGTTYESEPFPTG